MGGRDEAIVAVSRDPASGTFEVFNAMVMRPSAKLDKKLLYDIGASPATPPRPVRSPGCIAYVGLGFVDKTAKVLKINGVAPSRETVVSGQYPLRRPLFLWTRG